MCVIIFLVQKINFGMNGKLFFFDGVATAFNERHTAIYIATSHRLGVFSAPANQRLRT